MFFATKKVQCPQTEQSLEFLLNGQKGAVTTLVLATLTPVTYNSLFSCPNSGVRPGANHKCERCTTISLL